MYPELIKKITEFYLYLGEIKDAELQTTETKSLISLVYKKYEELVINEII